MQTFGSPLMQKGLSAPTVNLRTGEYHTTLDFRTVGTLIMVANQLYAAPFVVPRNLTVDRIMIEVTTGAALANARLGIYNDGTNLYPGTLLLDAGTVSVAVAAILPITISQTLTQGLYWLAFVSDGTPTIRAHYFQTPLGWQSTSPNNHNSGWGVAFTYAALPDPFTAAGSLLQGQTAGIWLRVLSLD